MFKQERRVGLARIGWLELDGLKVKTPFIIDYLDKPEIVDKIDFGIAPTVLKEIDKHRFEILGSKDENLIVATGLSVLSPRKLVETLLELRMSSFKPLYAVALAEPVNIPLLLYLGVDIFDNILAIAKAYRGIYFTEFGEVELSKLKELPCNCPVCLDKSPDDLDAKDVARHNTLVMQKVL